MLKRIGVAVPSLIIITIVVFMIVHSAPGDPAIFMAGETGASPQYIEGIRKLWGLDRPLQEQLWVYLVNVAQGNLGYSLTLQRSVLGIILERLPYTFLLIGIAELFALVGIFFAVEAGSRLHSTTDDLLSVASVVGYSLPYFWLGQILLIVFSLSLGLFPAGGLTSLREQYIGLAYVLDLLWHAALPGITLGLVHLTLVFRVTKVCVADVNSENYIVLARAKGLTERRVKYVHILKNVLIPLITLLALNFGGIVAGTLMTEIVFSWPGLGTLLQHAVTTRDYPLVSGIFIIMAGIIIFLNLVTDITYRIVDPRVR